MIVGLQSYHEGTTVHLFDWITIGELQIEWAFRVDTLSVTMMSVVGGVGTLIHIYAIGYMHEDVRFKNDPGRFRRFFVFFNLFIAMMMILVSADNYLMLFVGWEGVGLCSYLLIGFWYDKDLLGRDSDENASAGKKAFITNRVGDFGFLIASFIMFWTFKSVQFDDVLGHAQEIAQENPGAILAITLFMLLGVAGKSAQIPLYVWLPDAMAGPTPVSALIHAATMVTAGVYLVARSAPLYETVPEAQTIVTLVGAATALFAATIAVGQYDIKKVLAYSTISQLGFMVAAVGLGAYVAGMFHLVTHAFFKALLFMTAGSVILGIERGHHHAAHDHHGDGDHEEEVFDPGDMRNMGGLRKKMPISFWLYMIGTLALAGLPPFSGFFSKDEILLDGSERNPLGYALLAIAAFFTAFYMGRQVWMVFFGKSRHEAAEHAEESPPIMTIPLMVLAFLSIFGGALNLPEVHTFGHWLEYTYEKFHLHLHIPEFSFLIAGSSTGLALLAIFISWFFYARKGGLQKGQPDPLKRFLGPVFTWLENKWYVDELYQLIIIRPYQTICQILAELIDWDIWHDWFHDTVIAGSFKWLARITAVNIDLGIIDGIANGLGSATQGIAARTRRLQTGFVRNYALVVFLGVVVILGYLIFW
jgi:NADH-quinone oxidoreductase subunit L